MAANLSLDPSHESPASVQQPGIPKRQPFDQLHYQKLIRARGETIRDVLHRVKPYTVHCSNKKPDSFPCRLEARLQRIQMKRTARSLPGLIHPFF